MKAIFFGAMEGQMPELIDVPEKDGHLDFAWMKEKIGHGCDTLDSTLRTVDGKAYRFLVDDLGFYNANLTAYGSDSCWLFGNLFIFGREDKYGELTEVTEDDVAYLSQHVGMMFNKKMLFELGFPKRLNWTAEELARMAAGGDKHEEK